jgi:hypothetical protein
MYSYYEHIILQEKVAVSNISIQNNQATKHEYKEEYVVMCNHSHFSRRILFDGKPIQRLLSWPVRQMCSLVQDAAPPAFVVGLI